MPRKKPPVDPLDVLVDYFEVAPLEACHVMLSVAIRILRRRDPDPKQARVVKPPTGNAPPPVGTLDERVVTGEGSPLPKKQKVQKRRMTVASRRPANEAAPIVPPVETVGEDDAAYEGQ